MTRKDESQDMTLESQDHIGQKPFLLVAPNSHERPEKDRIARNTPSANLILLLLAQNGQNLTTKFDSVSPVFSFTSATKRASILLCSSRGLEANQSDRWPPLLLMPLEERHGRIGLPRDQDGP